MNPEDDSLIQQMNDLKQVFRGDWVGTVLVMLRRGRRRHRELRDNIRNWSLQDPWTGIRRRLNNAELARTLARMTDDGLVIRTPVSDQWQPAVFYELSNAGQELLAAVSPLLEWAAHHPDFFAAAREARIGDDRDNRRAP